MADRTTTTTANDVIAWGRVVTCSGTFVSGLSHVDARRVIPGRLGAGGFDALCARFAIASQIAQWFPHLVFYRQLFPSRCSVPLPLFRTVSIFFRAPFA